MKKPYQKPRVYAESFELLEHIASCKVNGGEGGITTVTYRSAESGCTYSDGKVTLFLDSNSSCTNEYWEHGQGDYDTWNQYLDSFKPENGGGCYNAFADGNFFAS